MATRPAAKPVDEDWVTVSGGDDWENVSAAPTPLFRQSQLIDRMLKENPQPPPYYGFTPMNMLNNFMMALAKFGGGSYQVLKDLIQNPNWIYGKPGKPSTLEKFVMQPSEEMTVKAGQALQRGQKLPAVGYALASALPFAGPFGAELGEQAGKRDIGGALSQATAAYIPAKLASRALIRKPPPSEKQIEAIPEQMVYGLGATSLSPEVSVRTYRQAMPYLADIEREGLRVAPKARTPKVIFGALDKKVSQLGRPVEQAVEKYGSEPLGGDPEVERVIRKLARSSVGKTITALQATDVDQVKLADIGTKPGPLTIDEGDFLRQRAHQEAATYHKAQNAGNVNAAKQLSEWVRAENYVRNLEYNKLRQLTGLDIDKIQSDRTALLRVKDAAMRNWARELRTNPEGLAQSIGVPFGISRVLRGGIALDPYEMLSGLTEVAAFKSWRRLMSPQHVLKTTMKTLGRTTLTAPVP